MIRVVLPAHLRTLARVNGEVTLDLEGPVTRGAILDTLEARYPALRGTIRDQVTLERRSWTVPSSLPFGASEIVPMCAGETLAWQLRVAG